MLCIFGRSRARPHTMKSRAKFEEDLQHDVYNHPITQAPALCKHVNRSLELSSSFHIDGCVRSSLRGSCSSQTGRQQSGASSTQAAVSSVIHNYKVTCFLLYCFFGTDSDSGSLLQLQPVYPICAREKQQDHWLHSSLLVKLKLCIRLLDIALVPSFNVSRQNDVSILAHSLQKELLSERSIMQHGLRRDTQKKHWVQAV